MAVRPVSWWAWGASARRGMTWWEWSRPRAQTLAIVAMSPYPAQEVVRFGRVHAQAFLEEPVSLAELVDVVRCLLVQGQRARETARADSPHGPRIRVAAVGS